jgi:ADP-dependent NAD(P)H-hydrate dehydratase / NAD(P)H-hydrate epimerase
MPIPVITIAQMRDWEKATWATGQTEAEVIRRVGKCVAEHALRLTRPDDLIVILAGQGNNGEDARCAVDHLAQRRVNLLDVKDPGADFSKLDAILSLHPALVIDGLFGIGINRPLNADWIRFIERVNDSGSRILAVDVPSGLNGDTGEPQGAAIQASVTLTVGAPKVGMLHESAWPFVGRLEVATDVGLVACPLRSELNWTLAEDFSGFPSARAVSTHKGTYGHVGIIAGSVGFHGASVLAARGAQRAQPGLITLHTQEGAYHPVASQLQAVMVSPWKRDTNLSQYTAILVGPGLAAADLPHEIKELTRDLWLNSTVPVIIDASALAWLPPGKVRENAVRLITPHPGEAARLLGATSSEVQSDRLKSLRRLSERYGNTWVVLKGHETLIGRSHGEVFVNSSGNPHLAQGGSGDLLSGFLVGLLAQPALREDPLKTIRYAVWQHGAAADRILVSRPNWVIEDLAQELGREA